MTFPTPPTELRGLSAEQQEKQIAADWLRLAVAARIQAPIG